MTTLGQHSEPEAEKLLQMVVRLSAMNEGQNDVRDGGQAHADWRAGDTKAPLRLGALLDRDCKASTIMGKADA